jgi:hypothetical protein
MKDKVAEFAGGIPFYYDRELGAVLFAELAGDLARRLAAPQRKAFRKELGGNTCWTRMRVIVVETHRSEA